MAAPIDSYRKYSLVRVGHGLIVLALSYLTVFLLLFVLPGDPISARLNDPDSSYSPEQIDQLLAYYGMDQPLTVQLWRAVSRLFQGDLGYSLTTVEPVGERILQALPSTIQLSVITLVFSVLIALVLTVIATVAPALPVRRFAASVPAGLLSVPTFVFGLLVLQVFSYNLGLFSTLKTDGWVGALPAAAVLALPISAPFARVLIENAREVQTEPFVTFAKSKGMSTPRLLFAHIARPSSLPGVTMLGLAAAELITGSVIVEAIFNRHGIGSVIESAVSSQDSPVLLGVILLAAGVVVVVNLGVDLLYPLLDPRLKGAPTEAAATVTPTSVEALR
ncbi:ABC transporter permease [Rhodococcoides yunnanense]|uniref:ABC transporter permease n=1 Tax=Rhodococcoides yunnanense TaxID=278209 RepID=UPI0009344E87|nr:ABC transporter permease [Rhodococcus yunnanensis]